ncbi:peroxidase family protein [Membranihabitans marinus]|uniref:peroxidase family protein n=1 Tax=Membranihabitans marinus TaxID=1227546 RepID=UPI001F329FA1|nr:peroxidase family protein [Membranihabitans marinus]
MNIPRTRLIILFALLATSSIFAQTYRSYDGSGNNIDFPEYGASLHAVKVLTSLQYSDGINSPGGINRPNARIISNEMFAAVDNTPDVHNLSNLVWAFGKFLEHEITHFKSSTSDQIKIKIPQCDPFFDPNCTGREEIVIDRFETRAGSGTDIDNPRNVTNYSTAWIDASVLYGTDEKTALYLRSLEGGKLKVSEGNFLPFNTISGNLNGITDAQAPAMELMDPGLYRYFVSGDPRINQNLVIASMVTLFLREHNRLCDVIALESPGLTDEQIYQKARSLVSGMIQNITYNEWLPSIGIYLEEYQGYNPNIDPDVSNEFCAAGFKIWNTLQNERISLMDDRCETDRFGSIAFNDLLHDPLSLLQIDIDPLMKGLASERQLNMDYEVVDGIRNFELRSDNIEIKTDWIAMDIMRARERGLPDYNTMRMELGLAPIESFSEITSNITIQNKLKELYSNIYNIDPWVGIIAEDHFPKSMLGETLNILIRDQFSRIRNGDRYYFENDETLSETEKNLIRNTKMVDILTNNTNISFIQENVFKSEPRCFKGEIIDTHLSGMVFPNPVVNEMDISLFSRINGPVNLKIIDTYGKVISDQIVEVEQGMNIVKCTVNPSLSAGMYFVSISDQSRTGLIKFIKTN